MIGAARGRPGHGRTTCSPDPGTRAMLQAADALPLNLGFLGKGNASRPEALVEQILGAARLKLHETGARRPPHRLLLSVAEQYDVQVAIHTTRSTNRIRRDTLAAFKGARSTRTTPRGGRGTRPTSSSLRRAARAALSTNPTRPYTINTIDEHPTCSWSVTTRPRDRRGRRFAESRIRRRPSPRGHPHDLGAFSMLSSDSQPWARGEVITRTWQTAHKISSSGGALPRRVRGGRHDNFRVKRYVAKYTINPALTHASRTSGSVAVASSPISSVAPGLLRRQAHLIIKGAHRVRAMRIPTPRSPRRSRCTSARCSRARGARSHERDVRLAAGLEAGIARASPAQAPRRRAARANGAQARHGVERRPATMEVDPQTYESARRQLLTCEPATVLPLAQRYFLSESDVFICASCSHGATGRPPPRPRHAHARRARSACASRSTTAASAVLLPRGSLLRRRRSAARRQGDVVSCARRRSPSRWRARPIAPPFAGYHSQPPRARRARRRWLAYEHDHVLDDMCAGSVSPSRRGARPSSRRGAFRTTRHAHPHPHAPRTTTPRARPRARRR